MRIALDAEKQIIARIETTDANCVSHHVHFKLETIAHLDVGILQDESSIPAYRGKKRVRY